MLITEKDLVGLPIHASQISHFECKKKLAVYILGLAKGIKFQVNESKHMLAGNIIHSILQDTFRFNFSTVEYHYNSVGLSVKDALKETFSSEYNKWKKLMDIPIQTSIWANMPSSVSEIDEKISKQLNNLAEMAISLVEERDSEIFSKVIGEEFRISHKLNRESFLVGKIDLLVRTDEPKNFRLIELKTSKKRYQYEKDQLRIYGEVFKKAYPTYEINLELWHPHFVKKRIEYIKLEQEKYMVNKINDFIEVVLSISKESDLPDDYDNSFYCNNFCGYCREYIPDIF